MKALTANRLSDGAVVYRSAFGWTTDLAQAQAFDDAALGAAMVEALAAETEIVGPYAFTLDANGRPDGRVGARETIRAGGPTIPIPSGGG